jgi:hypothetical protein
MIRSLLLASLAILVLGGSPAFAADPPLPQQPAAEIDPSSFSHAMPFSVPPSPDGVARLRLGPAVLATARADLADLRVIDASSRQWPYVLRPEVDREEFALRVDLQRGERGRSRYLLALPVSPIAVDAVTLRIDRAFFDRAYRLTGERATDTAADPSRTTLLASGRLTRAAGAPDTIDLAFPRTRVTSLALLVEDGDEAPLPIAAAHASAPLAELRLVAPAGNYTLLAGDPDAEAPRYEIANLRDRVLAARAVDCTPAALVPNPTCRPLAGTRGGFEQLALWGAMGLAVVALVALTLRLSRREGERKGSPPE